MEALFSDFSFGLFLWQTILFLGLFFLLKKFAWKPILSAVNEREESIEEALNQAKKAREEMTHLKSENDKILKEAKAERDAILKEAREMKDQIINEAKETAKTEATRLVDGAKVTINNEKMAAMTDLRNQVANLSITIAEKVMKSELSENNKQQELVETLMKESNFN